MGERSDAQRAGTRAVRLVQPLAAPALQQPLDLGDQFPSYG
jgi:hypothetical protein